MASGKWPVKQFNVAIPYHTKSSFGGILGERFKILARAHVVAHVHQRHGIIILLFGRLEVGDRLAQLLVAAIQMDRSAIGEFGTRTSHYFLEAGLGAIVLVRLQRLQSSFIVLYRLGKTRIVGQLHRFTCPGSYALRQRRMTVSHYCP